MSLRHGGPPMMPRSFPRLASFQRKLHVPGLCRSWFRPSVISKVMTSITLMGFLRHSFAFSPAKRWTITPFSPHLCVGFLFLVLHPVCLPSAAAFPSASRPPPPPTHNLLTHNLHTHTQLTHIQPAHTQLTHIQPAHTHNLQTHTQLTHIRPAHTQLAHTHNLLTHNLLTHNLHTHNLLTHNLLTHNLLTHNLLTHNLLTHNLLTHNLLTYNLLTYTLLTYNLLTHNLLTHNLQAWHWHFVTSTFTLCGRRGTS